MAEAMRVERDWIEFAHLLHRVRTIHAELEKEEEHLRQRRQRFLSWLNWSRTWKMNFPFGLGGA